MNIEELIREHARVTAFTIEWHNTLQKDCRLIPTHSNGELLSYRVVEMQQPFEGRTASRLDPLNERANALLIAANEAWHNLEGPFFPGTALDRMKLARVEFTRCEIYTLLFNSPQWEARNASQLATLQAIAAERNWLDADSVARNPMSIPWCAETGAFAFNEWCAGFDWDSSTLHVVQGEPGASAAGPIKHWHMMSAIALTWIDQFAHDESSSLALLGEAMSAVQDGSFYLGWESADEYRQEELSTSGKRAADARHAENRRMRDRARELYMSGNYLSKDHAAEEIAGKLIPASFRTVRRYIAGLPSTPQSVPPASHSGRSTSDEGF